MAYERRFSLAFLFLGLIGAFTSAIAAAANSISDAVRSFGSLIDWPDFKPDAAASLALDRIARFGASLDLAGRMSRFKSFFERALLHDRFDGEHFDPGRAAA